MLAFPFSGLFKQTNFLAIYPAQLWAHWFQTGHGVSFSMHAMAGADQWYHVHLSISLSLSPFFVFNGFVDIRSVVVAVCVIRTGSVTLEWRAALAVVIKLCCHYYFCHYDWGANPTPTTLSVTIQNFPRWLTERVCFVSMKRENILWWRVALF